MIIDITDPAELERAAAEAGQHAADLAARQLAERTDAEQMAPTMHYVSSRRLTTIRLPAGEAAVDPVTGSVTMAVDLEYLKRLLRDGAYALAQCREHARAVQRTTAGRRRTDWVGLL